VSSMLCGLRHFAIGNTLAPQRNVHLVVVSRLHRNSHRNQTEKALPIILEKNWQI
jgi:hypothetical protein